MNFPLTLAPHHINLKDYQKTLNLNMNLLMDHTMTALILTYRRTIRGQTKLVLGENTESLHDSWSRAILTLASTSVLNGVVEGKPHLLLQNGSNLIGLVPSLVEGETPQRLPVQGQLVEGLGKKAIDARHPT
jgi:hypothetical protein